ncbi:MAG TPA: hypothetical protein VF092_18125 [Longimicrobium sp.]
MIQITCPQCKRELRIEESDLGRMAKCRFCEHTFLLELPRTRMLRFARRGMIAAAIATAVAAWFSFSVLVAFLYWGSLLAWAVLRRSKRLVPKAAAAILGPATIGLGLVVWTLVRLNYAADSDPQGPRWLATEQAFFLDAWTYLKIAKSLSIFLLVLAVAAVVHNFWPRTEALKRVLTLKGHVGRLWLVVVTVTTFTFIAGSVGTAEAARLDEIARQSYRAAFKERAHANQRVQASAAVDSQVPTAVRPLDAAALYAAFKAAVAGWSSDTIRVWVPTEKPPAERIAERVTSRTFARLRGSYDPGPRNEPTGPIRGPESPRPQDGRGGVVPSDTRSGSTSGAEPHVQPSRPVTVPREKPADREIAGPGPTSGLSDEHNEVASGAVTPEPRLEPVNSAAEWKARREAASTIEAEAQQLDAMADQNEAAAKKVIVEAAGKVFSSALADVEFGDFISAFLKKVLDLYATSVRPGRLFNLSQRFARTFMSTEVTRDAFAADLEQQLLKQARDAAAGGQWSTALEQLDLLLNLDDSAPRRAAAALHPEYMYRQGAYLHSSGSLDAAATQYQRTIEKHPATRWAREARRGLADVNIARQVRDIEGSDHEPLAIPESKGPSGRRGQAAVSIENGTGRTLTVYFSGPRSDSAVIGVGQTTTLWLPVGAYSVAARVNDPDVLPYAGPANYTARIYPYYFYIGRR